MRGAFQKGIADAVLFRILHSGRDVKHHMQGGTEPYGNPDVTLVLLELHIRRLE